ncbi:hypothetical protein Golob_001029, partial [Gossypium lobatum]|nr:hypothetical protein [Gossypium lobatum]
MKKFDDKIPAREFDNFQFVNFTGIMSKNISPKEKETAFALAALMEIPLQYKAVIELGILGQRTGKAKKVVPRPPPVSYRRPTPAPPERIPSNVSSSSPADDQTQATCPICLTNTKDLAFNCGHTDNLELESLARMLEVNFDEMRDLKFPEYLYITPGYTTPCGTYLEQLVASTQFPMKDVIILSIHEYNVKAFANYRLD